MINFILRFIYLNTSVNTAEAVDHDRQGTSTKGFGQAVAASEAI